MSRVLILGASFLQLPAIIKAKELGHYVAVADYNPNAKGIRYADEYYKASTIDIESVCRIAKIFQPEGIITLATDLPMRSVAAATNLLGLPGIKLDTAIRATDKGEMIRAFKDNHVSAPWFFIINSEDEFLQILEEVRYPCIIKPTDNSGSRGVILVEDQSEIRNAYSYSRSQSREGKVILEEFLRGDEVSVEVMVLNGKSHIIAVTDKLTTGAPYFVEMGHSQQSRLNFESVEMIKKEASRAVNAVGIENGPAHVEIIVTENGPKLVELGARLGGDCITTHLVPLSTGIDMVKATIDVSLGLNPDISQLFERGSAIKYFSVPPGVIESIRGVEQAKSKKGIKEVTLTKNIGEVVSPVQSSADRVGFVIAQGADSEEAIHICEEAINMIEFTMS